MKSPSEHYAEADRLMSQEVVKANPTLPIARAYTAQAAVHAALAQCGRPSVSMDATNANQAVDDLLERVNAGVIDARTTGDRL